jgi:hypothetical protein
MAAKDGERSASLQEIATEHPRFVSRLVRLRGYQVGRNQLSDRTAWSVDRRELFIK